MRDISIRILGENEWQRYRSVRLAALKDAPEAFVAAFASEASYDDGFWRERMTRAYRLVAESGDEPVGLVCLGLHNLDPETGEVFGLWTAPRVRGRHVAWDLVSIARQQATEDGCRLLYYWVVSDNGAAVGFASGFGFRPTSERRPVRVTDGEAERNADEVAMVLSLSEDPSSPNPYRQ